MATIGYLKTIPSFLTGSVRQTLATLDKPAALAGARSRPIVLIPGAFCTASVMNRLGLALERLGRGSVLAPTFPYYYSALANTCRLDQAVDQYVAWLADLHAETGVEEVDVAAHSNGGLITLMAQARFDAGQTRAPVQIHRVVTMATPFGGFPGAKPLSLVLPCCKDLTPDAPALSLARRAGDRVARCLVSEGDSLIPPERQFIDLERRTGMPGFQHMDFIVGTADKIDATAREVVRWLANDC